MKHWAARPAIIGLIVPALLGLAWEFGVRGGWIPGRLMPPPSALWTSAVAMVKAGELQTHIAATPDARPCAAALGDAERHHGRGRPTGSIGA